MAYSSDESGRPEIYVQPFPGLGPKIQISNGGGTDAVWRRSGGELYYRARESPAAPDKMMVVSVATTGSELRPSAPRLLWEGAYLAGNGASCEMPGPGASNYDVTPDGERFLMVRDDSSVSTSVGTRIVVVLNFAEEVKAKERARLGS